jgi:NAD(P)-dependent dehydrogenase (short-subunit alcohol dehydrogenase family)
MEKLAGKIAVITGGASGIGRGMAEAFMEEGMSVVLGDIDAEQLESTVGELSAQGAAVLGVVSDVADPDAVMRLRDATFEAFGTAHLVCNNAGIGARASLTDTIDVESWRRVFNVDFFAILHGLNAFLPRLLEQREGHIVNTSSRQGLVPLPHIGPYPPAKFASVAVTEMLHAELAELGSPVGASVLTPGAVLTGMTSAGRERHAPGNPAGVETNPFLDRVANAVSPIEVGRLVVKAVREGNLYINTHRETIGWIQARTDRIAADARTLGTLK